MPKTSVSDLTASQLRRMLAIKEQIESLESELNAIVGNGAVKVGRRGRKPKSVEAKPLKKARRKMSAASRAKMRAAAKARWAKARAIGKKTL